MECFMNVFGNNIIDRSVYVACVYLVRRGKKSLVDLYLDISENYF